MSKGNPNPDPGNKATPAPSQTTQTTQTPPAQPPGSSGTPTSANGGGRVVVVPTGSGTSSSVSAERKVDSLLRQMFRGPVPEKPAELRERLNQIIQPKKSDERRATEYEYSTTAVVPAGPTVGQSVAQTSLSSRAQAARADAEKRLNELRPMGTPSDPESLTALRSVALSTYKRLVKELGEGGGPRNKRAEKLFDALIGPQVGDLKLIDDSLLGKIKKEFKLTVDEVKSAEDSANLASFRIVLDNLFAVHRSWTGFKGELKDDFGQRSTKFSRNLGVIEADINDVETALDEAGHDATDRANEIIDSDEGEAEKLTIGSLLSWIREFASEEAPELVDAGGTIGFGAIIPTLTELEKFVGQLKAHVTKHVKNNENVIAALDSLQKHLTEALTDAKAIAPAAKAP